MTTSKQSNKGSPLGQVVPSLFPNQNANIKSRNIFGALALMGMFIGVVAIIKRTFLKSTREVCSLEKAILDKIRKEELFAYGYLAPHQEGDEKTLIPNDAIESANFKKGYVRAVGREFSNVEIYQRLFKAGEAEDLKQGRPSYSDAIHSVFQKIKTQLDFTKSKRYIIDQFIEFVAKEVNAPLHHHGKNKYKGLGYQAINNQIGYLIDAEMAKTKKEALQKL